MKLKIRNEKGTGNLGKDKYYKQTLIEEDQSEIEKMRTIILKKIDPITGMMSGPLDEEMVATDLWKKILEKKGLPLNTPYVLKNEDEYLTLTRSESYCDYLWRRIYQRRGELNDDTEKKRESEEDEVVVATEEEAVTGKKKKKKDKGRNRKSETEEEVVEGETTQKKKKKIIDADEVTTGGDAAPSTQQTVAVDDSDKKKKKKKKLYD